MSKDKTIIEVVKNDLCLGCGTCLSLCPRSAIELFKDGSKGLYVPRLDKVKCDQCGICFEVCPGHGVDFKVLNMAIFHKEPEDALLGNYLHCYVGHTTDLKMRFDGTSGGMVTALLLFALKEGIIDGALVTTMKRGNPLQPEPIIARSEEEIISAAKSKYCPVPANVALAEILVKPGRYAVVGLPCHLHGIRKAEKVDTRLRERVVLHLGLFCSTSKSFLATEHLLQRIGVEKGSVVKVDYRGQGWPGKLVIQLKDGRMKSMAVGSYYDMNFCSFVPWRCTLCRDGASELSDISFGDAWLPEIKSADDIGSSLVVSRTRFGEDILQGMVHKGKAELEPISANRVEESQGRFYRQKRRLKGYFLAARVLRRKVPLYYKDLSISPSVGDYFNIALLHSRRFLAFRRSLWWLLDIYCWGLTVMPRIAPWVVIKR